MPDYSLPLTKIEPNPFNIKRVLTSYLDEN